MLAHGADFLSSVIDSKFLGALPHIICIQETWYNDFNVISIPSYVCICENRPDGRRGGLAIYLKNGINFQVINTIDNRNIEFQRIDIFDIFGKRGVTSIFNFYNPCKKIELADLKAMVGNIPGKMLILGDFNSHNNLWGSNKLDSNGKTVELFIEESDLALLNDGSPTRLDPYHGTFSHLDLSLVSKELSWNMEWKVLSNNFGSDHNLICINFRNVYNKPNDIGNVNVGYKWCFRNVNWDVYKTEIDEALKFELNRHNTSLDVQSQYNTIVKVIKKAANKCIKRAQIGGNKRKKVNPWWNNECKKAIQERNFYKK